MSHVSYHMIVRSLIGKTWPAIEESIEVYQEEDCRKQMRKDEEGKYMQQDTSIGMSLMKLRAARAFWIWVEMSRMKRESG